MSEVLEIAGILANARTTGAFIDRAMAALSGAVAASLVSFNKVSIATRSGTVALRPYRPEHEIAVEGVATLFDEHPLFHWYTSQADWSPVRISDVMPWREFSATRLLTEILAPVGASHAIAIMLTPPATGRWVYFMVNRGDRDFSDAELGLCRGLQPALVALYANLSQPRGDGPGLLTRQESAVLGYLADGLTASAIARRLGASPATVRKHLQNVYAKLGISDRLGAVLRARDLGLLDADDVSGQFDWNCRLPERLPG
jgi:DNA-binding CsgD family transcriptional regulator